MVEFAQRCTATNTNGEPCKRAAELGTPVCHYHGGKAPQTLKAADRREKEETAARAAALLGVPVDTDPHRALIEELRRSQGVVFWLEQQIQEQGKTGFTENTMSGEQPSIWYKLWTRERDRLSRVAVECAKAGVAERRVAMVEENGRQLAQFARGLLHELQIPLDEHVTDVVRKQLAALPTIIDIE